MRGWLHGEHAVFAGSAAEGGVMAAAPPLETELGVFGLGEGEPWRRIAVPFCCLKGVDKQREDGFHTV